MYKPGEDGADALLRELDRGAKLENLIMCGWVLQVKWDIEKNLFLALKTFFSFRRSVENLIAVAVNEL